MSAVFYYLAKTITALLAMILSVAMGVVATLLITRFFLDGSEPGNPDYNAGIAFMGLLPLGLILGFFAGLFLSAWTWYRFPPSRGVMGTSR